MQPILLVEDSEDDAVITQAMLKKAEVLNPVLVLSDGAKAIAYLKGDGFYADRELFPLPRVVLLDLKMPVKNGFKVLEWWQTQPQLKDLLMVVLSGYRDWESVKRAYSLGAQSFLVKPCKVEDLLNLRQTFSHYWGQSALQPPKYGGTNAPG
jgi:CheY-like chemotaxis protein